MMWNDLDLAKIIPFGHSVGGAMAIATAARRPDRCAAVITESAQSFVEDQTLSAVRTAQVEFATPGQFDRLARYHGAKADWILNAWIGTWLAPAFAQWSLDEDLHRVQCPSLVLHGDRDEYGSLRHPGRIERFLQSPCHVTILDGCAHVPHREQQTRVLSEVTRFLAALEVTAVTP